MTEIVRFIEPAKAFQCHLHVRNQVRDFSCALGISSPVGSFPGVNAVGLLCLSNTEFFWKKEDFLLYTVQRKWTGFAYCVAFFHLNTEIKLIFLSQAFIVTSLT